MRPVDVNDVADEITLKDIFVALELNEGTFASSHYAQILFGRKEHVIESEKKIEMAVAQGMERFHESLDKLKVSDILEAGAWQEGIIQWENKTKERESSCSERRKKK